MTLPRFQFPEEEDGDATAPAEFVLKLPASYARKLARFESAAPTVWPTPSAPWTIETARAPASARWHARTTLVAVLASLAVAIVVLVGVGRAVAQAGGGEGPVGISMRAPKSLDGFVRAAVRESGVAARVRAATVESLHHGRHRPHARRRR